MSTDYSQLFGLVNNNITSRNTHQEALKARQAELQSKMMINGMKNPNFYDTMAKEYNENQKKIIGTPEYEAEQKRQANTQRYEEIAREAEHRQNQRKKDENAVKLLENQEAPKPQKYNTAPPRVAEPNNLKPQVTRQPLTMADDTANIDDPLLGVSHKLMEVGVPIPTDWVAVVLAVQESPHPDPKVQKEFVSQKLSPYKVWARRIQPAGEELTGEVSETAKASNTDLVLQNPCQLTPPMAPNKRWNAILSHPVYFPVNPTVPQPSAGDLVHVILEPDQANKQGVLLGLVPSGDRPLPETLEEFRTPQSTKAALAKNYPETTGEETDSSGCATGTVTVDDIKKLNFITLKNPKTYLATLPQMKGNARRFIKALDEELSKLKTRAIITSTIRTDTQQGIVMFNNWLNHRPPNFTARVVPPAERNKYIKKLYNRWSGLERMLVEFESIAANGGWNYKESTASQQKVNDIIAANSSPHSSGTAIDISFRGNTSRVWVAVKKAAKRTCSSILIEKDHFHINAKSGNKFRWSNFSSQQFAWLDSAKGPAPTKEVA